MDSGAPSAWTTEPFRMGSDDEFVRVRALFERYGFTEPHLVAIAGVQSMHHFGTDEANRLVLRDAIDAQSLLVRLFIDCASVPWPTVRHILPQEDLATIEALGLLHTSAADGQCESTVALSPTGGVYVAADRHRGLHMSGANPPADLVYSPMTKEAFRVLSLMPHTRCEDFLEVCSGTGVAALIAGAHFADRAVAVDITERCTRFARFNIALNGLDNVTALRGDVYAPVEGQQFDVIVAHPPYMPSFGTEYVYRDGGEDGEQITRRVIAGLPAFLRPGGQFFCDCMMSDRKSAPVQDRLREMLGPRASEFDVIVAESRSLDPIAYYSDLARQRKISFSSIEQRHEAFARLGIDRFVSVSMLLHRGTGARSAVTTRRVLTPLTTRDDFQWLLRWCGASAEWTPEDARRLLDSAPRVLPRVQVRSRSSLQEGQWLIEEATLTTGAPFGVEASCPPWFVNLVSACDGRMTGRQHLARLREMGIVPPDGGEDAFASMLRQLVDSGLVEVAAFPLPDATAMRGQSRGDQTGGARVP